MQERSGTTRLMRFRRQLMGHLNRCGSLPTFTGISAVPAVSSNSLITADQPVLCTTALDCECPVCIPNGG